MKKIYLLIALALIALFSSAMVLADSSPVLSGDLNCGTAMIAGEFHTGNDFQPYITVYPGTTDQYRITLFGVTAKQAMTHEGLTLKLKATITRAGANVRPVAKVTQFFGVMTGPETLKFGVKLLNRAACRTH